MRGGWVAIMPEHDFVRGLRGHGIGEGDVESLKMSFDQLIVHGSFLFLSRASRVGNLPVIGKPPFLALEKLHG